MTIAMVVMVVMTSVSCATKKGVGAEALTGEWAVKAVKGTAINETAGDNAPFIGFSAAEKQVYGSLGCNRLTGVLNYDAATGEIDFSHIGSTRMMCPDMTNEDLILRALPEVKQLKVKAGTMVLADEQGNEVMTLKKR